MSQQLKFGRAAMRAFAYFPFDGGGNEVAKRSNTSEYFPNWRVSNFAADGLAEAVAFEAAMVAIASRLALFKAQAALLRAQHFSLHREAPVDAAAIHPEQARRLHHVAARLRERALDERLVRRLRD